jgi:tetratricopeptide (TPR) repeat protein
MRFAPANAKAQNNLAWILATGKDASLRDGTKAVELARQANESAGGTDPNRLDTLAAALAEAGKFSDAINIGQKALELARAAGRQDLVTELTAELKLYESGLPCRQ